MSLWPQRRRSPFSLGTHDADASCARAPLPRRLQQVWDIIHPERRNLTYIRGYARLGGNPDDPHSDPQDRSWYGPHDRLFRQEESEAIRFKQPPKYGAWSRLSSGRGARLRPHGATSGPPCLTVSRGGLSRLARSLTLLRRVPRPAVWCWGWDGAGDLEGPDVEPVWELMVRDGFSLRVPVPSPVSDPSRPPRAAQHHDRPCRRPTRPLVHVTAWRSWAGSSSKAGGAGGGGTRWEGEARSGPGLLVGRAWGKAGRGPEAAQASSIYHPQAFTHILLARPHTSLLHLPLVCLSVSGLPLCSFSFLHLTLLVQSMCRVHSPTKRIPRRPPPPLPAGSRRATRARAARAAREHRG